MAYEKHFGSGKVKKKPGKAAMRKRRADMRRKAVELERTRNLLVYGEPKKGEATHEAYQVKIQSSDYSWNSEKVTCPACRGTNSECYKCGGLGWV